MGNPSLQRHEGPTPCPACRFYGGQRFSEAPHGLSVICDCPNTSGSFLDADNGCRFWMAPLEPRRDGKRIIVCGGRNYFEKEKVFAALDKAHAKSPIRIIVHGAAPGADLLAGIWAKDRGILREEHPAHWRTLGNAAGPIRNKEMADAGADGLVSFPGGSGTANMCSLAEAAGIPIWRPYG